MLIIDGAIGEGGGQVLRSALALSLCYGRSFHINHIRKNRPKPGLRRQHLVCVESAAQIGHAQVVGAELGSKQLRFIPREIAGGEYRFNIGTAGSTNLVLQTLLPALLTAEEPSRLVLEGGTHNPMAPSFDFLQRVFLPLLNKMGPHITMTLERPGFYPAGGGRVVVEVLPTLSLKPLYLLERGQVLDMSAEVLSSRLPEHIAERELRVLAVELGLGNKQRRVRHVDGTGPGNVVMVQVESKHITELFIGFGKRGIRAETVAQQVALKVQRYLDSDVPVGEHLADQLLLPLLLAGGGAFITLKPSLHTTTNIEVLQQFSDSLIRCEELASDRWRVRLN